LVERRGRELSLPGDERRGESSSGAGEGDPVSQLEAELELLVSERGAAPAAERGEGLREQGRLGRG
jgi:hypothetical protein